MSGSRPDFLRSRIFEARSLLTAQLEKGGGGDEVEKIVRHLGFLENLARARRRRRSALWALGAVAAALIAATILRFSALDQVDMAVVAETRAFVFVNGERPAKLLDDVLLREVTADGQGIALCTDPRKLRAYACTPAAVLRLNTVEVYKGATVAVRQIGSCFEVAIFEGGARAEVSALPPAGQGDWGLEELKVGPNESISFCPIESATLHCNGIESLTVGDRIGGARSEQEDAPALAKASLSIPATATKETFLGTDIPRLGGLENGVAVARLSAPMEISLVGKARRMTVETGSHQRDLMPSRLDWLLEAPKLKAALAFLVAILGAVVAVRERWLGEFDKLG